MLKLIEETQKKYVTPSEMKDGEIGVVRKHNNIECIGELVQRYGDALVNLGKNKGEGWSTLSNCPTFQIEILPKGTKFEIV